MKLANSSITSSLVFPPTADVRGYTDNMVSSSKIV